MGYALPTAPDNQPPAIHALPDPTAANGATALVNIMQQIAPPAPKKRGSLSLGGIAKSADAKPGTKTYPSAVLTDEQRAMCSALLAQSAQLKALEGSTEQLKAELKGIVLPQWFAIAQGQIEPPSSIIVPGENTDTGMFTVAGETGGRYTGLADAGAVERLAGIVGEEAFALHFEEKTTLKVELEKVAEDKQQALVDALLAVFEEHGCSHAVTAKQLTTFKPLSRKARFQCFPIAVNTAIDAVLPIIPSFKRRA